MQPSETEQTSNTESANTLQLEKLSTVVVDALEAMKGRDITVLDIADISDYADKLIIVSGTSKTHLKALANNVAVQSKLAGNPPISSEGETGSEWILIDLGDIIVHVMMPQTRDFYDLERLWSTRPAETQNH